MPQQGLDARPVTGGALTLMVRNLKAGVGIVFPGRYIECTTDNHHLECNEKSRETGDHTGSIQAV
jgi:hypothetical protein